MLLIVVSDCLWFWLLILSTNFHNWFFLDEWIEWGNIFDKIIDKQDFNLNDNFDGRVTIDFNSKRWEENGGNWYLQGLLSR